MKRYQLILILLAAACTAWIFWRERKKALQNSGILPQETYLNDAQNQILIVSTDIKGSYTAPASNAGSNAGTTPPATGGPARDPLIFPTR